MARRISMASMSAACARSWAAYSRGMCRFSSTLMLVKGLGIWKLRTMPSRVRRCAGKPARSCPSKRMRPPSEARAPEMQLMRVVLPEPLGPINPKRSPGFTWRLTRLRAVKPPKRLITACTSRRGVATLSAPQAAHQAEDALGGEHDEGHQHYAHDEQVHLRGDGHGGELLGRAQEHGADHRPDPARGAPDHGHGQRVHRVVEVEGGVRLHEGDVVGEGGSRHAEEEAAHRGGEELEAQGGHAHALRGLFVVAKSGQPATHPRALDEARR